jgi:hypothetical protein
MVIGLEGIEEPDKNILFDETCRYDTLRLGVCRLSD